MSPLPQYPPPQLYDTPWQKDDSLPVKCSPSSPEPVSIPSRMAPRTAGGVKLKALRSEIISDRPGRSSVTQGP